MDKANLEPAIRESSVQALYVDNPSPETEVELNAISRELTAITLEATALDQELRPHVTRLQELRQRELQLMQRFATAEQRAVATE